MNRNRSGQVFVMGMVTTMIGFVLGEALIGPEIGERIGFPIGNILEDLIRSTIPAFPRNYIPSMVAGLLYGAAAGLIYSSLQAIALRKWVKGLLIMVLLSASALSLATLINSGVVNLIYDTLGYSWLTSVLLGLITAPLSGLLVGLAQWAVLRNTFRNAIWWLIATALGWSVGLWISMLCYQIAFARNPDLELALPIELLIGALSSIFVAIPAGVVLVVVVRAVEEPAPAGEVVAAPAA